MYKATVQSTEQSTEQSTAQSTEQSKEQSTVQPTEQSTAQPTEQSTVQSNDTNTYGVGILAVLNIGVCVFFAYNTSQAANKKQVNEKQDQPPKCRHRL